MEKKYIFITGGVLSSLGKGLTSASIGMLLESCGLNISMLKLDPYLNIDPGTMNPCQHGEVYVTDDGAETDLDLGHYYRFTNAPLSKANNATSGQVYETVIQQERRGEYLGKTVQVIPHITNEIKKRIHFAAHERKETDLLLVEIGGTVGDIESQPFLEAVRQFCSDYPNNCICIHITYVPYLKAAQEIKTKPTQHSVHQLQSLGIFPDVIFCRSENPLEEDVKEKIALFCNVPKKAVIAQVDLKGPIYELPLTLFKQKLDAQLCSLLNIKHTRPDLSSWETMVKRTLNPKKTVTVGLIGKYARHPDAYKSVVEALQHGGLAHRAAVEIISCDSEETDILEGCDGYLIPGGFGKRGFEGKIAAAKYCRINHIPYFGICLGMQAIVVEFARSVLALKNANSIEMDPDTPHPVISILQEQREGENLGGTMRLGSYPCTVMPQTKAYAAYQQETIEERHRHRFECNPVYHDRFEKGGLLISGRHSTVCEIVEIETHPWMVGVQYHPEFKSKPLAPHPLFKAFIGALLIKKEKKDG